MRGRTWILLPLLGVPILLLLWWGLGRDPTAISSPLPGRMAPTFRLETLDGDTLDMADLRGQVVVLNFWASWCVPCIQEHPVLREAGERYREDGVRVVGVLYQDSRRNAIDFMERLGGDWPTVLDPGTRTAIDYGVYGVPETFFIDRTGRIAYKQIGPVNREVMTTWIERLLSAEPGELGAEPAVGRSEGYVPSSSADSARAGADSRPGVP